MTFKGSLELIRQTRVCQKQKLSEVRLRRKLKEDNGQLHNSSKNNGNVRYLPSATDGLTSANFRFDTPTNQTYISQ